MDLSIIIPCYNERENLTELVERIQQVLRRRRLAGELLLVDDGSTDGTGQAIASLRARFKNVVGLSHEHNRGIAASWRTAMARAQGRFVATFDADLQYQPEDLYRLYRDLLYWNADLVQGWRSHIGRMKDGRYLLSKGLNWLLNGLFPIHLRDAKSGFVICRREVLEDILKTRFRYQTLQTFIAVAAWSKGYSIREVETLFESRRLGRSSIPAFPLGLIMRVLQDLVKGWLEFRVLRRQPHPLEDLLRAHRPRRQEPLGPYHHRLYFSLYLWLMPLHHWIISRRAGRYTRWLRQSQWLSLEEIKAYQLLRLRQLVHHAYRHVPFYREAMDRMGIDPADIHTLEDLRKLPSLTKDNLRQSLHFDLMAGNHDKQRIFRIATSGSTGEPLVLYADQTQLEFRWATTLRNIEWTGYRFGDRQIRFWHTTLGLTRLQAWKERFDAWWCRRTFLSAYDISDQRVGEYIEVMRRAPGALIDGYAECFNLLAQFLKRHRITKVRPRAIISSAQTLPDHSREIIERQFHCRVFDKYGAREFSGIAHECEQHQGHHVNAESYIVELLVNGRPARPGEVGEVYVTDLNNYCVPLIRYRLGDLAEAIEEQCPCGRGLPRIGQIQGRLQAIIVGTNGQYLPGTFFAHLLKDYDHAIRQFQVVQTERNALTIKIVKAHRYSQVVFNEILDILRQHLGQHMRFDVQFVEEIPLGRTGKHLHSISQLPIRIPARKRSFPRQLLRATRLRRRRTLLTKIARRTRRG